MISAEALLLEGISDELSYRMALRLSFFVAEEASERQLVFAKAKKAYEVRSWIVHGKTGRTPRGLRALGYSKDASLTPFVDDFEQLMRRALCKALGHALRGPWPPAWEKLILGVH